MTGQIFQASNLKHQLKIKKKTPAYPNTCGLPLSQLSSSGLNGSVNIQLQIAVNFQQKYLHRQTMAAK